MSDRLKFQLKPADTKKTMIEITEKISIRDDELIFKASRSAGPGGQNVNKLNTRITLFFDVANCENFTDAQKRRILYRLSSRIDKNGLIRIVSQKFRTQRANRIAAIERLQELLSDVLRTKKVRKKTKVPYAARQRRLEQKRRRSQLKQQRAKKNMAGDFAD